MEIFEEEKEIKPKKLSFDFNIGWADLVRNLEPDNLLRTRDIASVEYRSNEPTKITYTDGKVEQRWNKNGKWNWR